MTALRLEIQKLGQETRSVQICNYQPEMTRITTCTVEMARSVLVVSKLAAPAEAGNIFSCYISRRLHQAEDLPDQVCDERSSCSQVQNEAFFFVDRYLQSPPYSPLTEMMGQLAVLRNTAWDDM